MSTRLLKISDYSFECGLRTPNFWEREAVVSWGWCHSKERWWVYIGVKKQYVIWHFNSCNEATALCTSLCKIKYQRMSFCLSVLEKTQQQAQCVLITRLQQLTNKHKQLHHHCVLITRLQQLTNKHKQLHHHWHSAHQSIHAVQFIHVQSSISNNNSNFNYCQSFTNTIITRKQCVAVGPRNAQWYRCRRYIVIMLICWPITRFNLYAHGCWMQSWTPILLLLVLLLDCALYGYFCD